MKINLELFDLTFFCLIDFGFSQWPPPELRARPAKTKPSVIKANAKMTHMKALC